MLRIACLTCLMLPLIASADAPKSRTFNLTYAGTITGQAAGATVKVWLPVPPSNDEQMVEIVSKKLPEGAKLSREPWYDNQMFYFETKAGADGSVPYEVVYKVTRKEIRGLTEPAMDANKIARFLQPDELVPITGKPLELLKGKTLPEEPMARARAFYDLVNGHMKYDKTNPGWGRGDSVWACDSKTGNCTDFHSLFISLARAYKIPAKFEMGFSIPEKRGSGEVKGYHCWAKFRPSDKGWVAVDISEANKDPKMKDYYFGNLTEDRVAISVGRDIDLVPRQMGKALNFFLAPYAEVEGKAVANDKIAGRNAYEDVK